MESQLTIVDYVVLGILLASGLIAAYRGFLKETLSVSSWLIAALGAVFFWPVTKPLARALVEPQIAADILALIGIFFLILIPASFISFRLSEIVRESSVGPLDRSLGFVFGIARGLLVVGMGFIVFSSLAIEPKNYPQWVREARLLPVVKGTADVIMSIRTAKKKNANEGEAATADAAVAPEETEHADNTSTKPAAKKPAAGSSNTGSHEDGGGEKRPSYSAGDRRALDELIKSTSKE